MIVVILNKVKNPVPHLHIKSHYGFFTSFRMTLLKVFSNMFHYHSMKIICFLLFFISMLSYSSLANNNLVKKNYDIIDSLLTSSTQNICSNLKKIGIDTVNLQIINHPMSWLLKQKLVERGDTEKVYFLYSDTLVHCKMPSLEISINKIDVNIDYLSMDTDSLQRTIELKIDAILKMKNGILQKLTVNNYQYKDSISYDELDNIRYSKYDFARTTLPEPKSNFFEKYLEPAIVITSAFITVFLFFSIRSN